MERKTPLYDSHVALEGKIVPFAGYLLPVQYPAGLIAEHLAVREKAGLFDVSHMGEIVYKGRDALANLNALLCNDFTSMTDFQVRYSPMCYDDGGCVDDLIVYRMGADCYLVVVNASNREKDFQWMKEHAFGDVTVEDISDGVAQIALQGPCSKEILSKLALEESIPEKYYRFVRGTVSGMDCLISQTGYTGENGFEIYLSNVDAPKLWELLLKAGEPYGLFPCGLGARDTLRLEAGMPLYGHELSPSIDPIESGLGFAVKLSKEAFIGREALLKKGEPLRKRVGLRMTGRGIAREDQEVFLNGAPIGRTTSGTHCPKLGYAAAMALVDAAHATPGLEVEVDVRGRKVAAQIVPLPFYKKK